MQAFDEIDSSVPDGWVPKDKVIILEEDLEIGKTNQALAAVRFPSR